MAVVFYREEAVGLCKRQRLLTVGRAGSLYLVQSAQCLIPLHVKVLHIVEENEFAAHHPHPDVAPTIAAVISLNCVAEYLQYL